MPRSSLGARTRQRLSVFAAAVLALGTFAFVYSNSAGAAEQTVNYPVNCSTIGALNVSITSSSTPATATAGGTVILNTAASIPPQNLAVGVNRATMVFTLPAQIASVTDVMFMGGNLTGSWRNSAPGTLELTFVGNGVNLSNISLPSLMITATVRAGTEGQTITWGGPTALSVVTSILTVNCTGDGSPLTTTPIAGSPTTTTTKATTTTTKATTTTTAASTSTTTKATTSTTTAASTSTTTKATTTSSTKAPTTTSSTTTTRTTPPPTWVNPFREYFRLLICRFFRLGC